MPPPAHSSRCPLFCLLSNLPFRIELFVARFKYASDVGYLIESASGSSYIMIGTKLEPVL